MAKVFRVVCVDISDEELGRLTAAKKDFPRGTLDNVEAAFAERCQWSTDPNRPNCIVFCMWDGRTPEQYEEAEITIDVKPTFRGMQPKRYSFAGKDAMNPLLPATVVTQTCGYKHCVNQEHLTAVGRNPNQYVS